MTPAGLVVLIADPAPHAGPGALVDVVLSHWLLAGAHYTAVCPVEAVDVWASLLRTRGARPDSRLLRPVDRHSHIAGVDLARAGAQPAEGAAMSTRGLGRAFEGILGRAGFPHPESYSVASLRLGGILALRHTGATVAELAAAARLSLRSNVLLDYVAAAEAWAPRSTLTLAADAGDAGVEVDG